MSATRRRDQEHKYLVWAIYRNRGSMSNITSIEPVKILSACSPFSATAIVRRDHNPVGARPSSYTASIILGDFRVNAFSNQTFSCEELLSLVLQVDRKLINFLPGTITFSVH